MKAVNLTCIRLPSPRCHSQVNLRQPCEVGTIVIIILQKRELNQSAQGYTAGEWQSQDKSGQVCCPRCSLFLLQSQEISEGLHPDPTSWGKSLLSLILLTYKLRLDAQELEVEAAILVMSSL